MPELEILRDVAEAMGFTRRMLLFGARRNYYYLDGRAWLEEELGEGLTLCNHTQTNALGIRSIK